jgi:hypothetical protein
MTFRKKVNKKYKGKFVKNSPQLIKHLQRHLADSQTAGSHFYKEAFPDAQSLINRAYQKIRGKYKGRYLVYETSLDKPVGEDNLISTNNLSKRRVKITREPRGKEGYNVNIVSGIPKKETSFVTIIAGPNKDGTHGFQSIFPGRYAPPFPVSKEKLIEEGYIGRELEKHIRLNKKYKQFWKRHAFIKNKAL